MAKLGSRWQRGSLGQRKTPIGLEWRGRFRVNHTGSDGNSKQISMHLGYVSEMSEAEAKAALAGMVSKINSEDKALKYFCLRGMLKKSGTPSRAAQNIKNTFPGHQRGAIGAVSEMIVCTDLLSKGIEVFRSCNAQAPCDLVALVGTEFVRIEVKTVPAADCHGIANLNLNKKIGKFDVLALVGQDGEISYRSCTSLESSRRVITGLVPILGEVKRQDEAVADASC